MRTVAASLIAIAGLVGACGKVPDPSALQATRVTVSDLKHHKVRVVIAAAELAAFNSHWVSKEDTGRSNENMPIESFQYFVDVEANAGGGRWLYSSEGLAAKLDHKAHTLYRFAKTQEFNRLLGVIK